MVLNGFVRHNIGTVRQGLTHLSLGKVADIFISISLNVKFCILIKISLKFIPKGGVGLGNDLVPNRRQAIIWTIADPVHRRIYSSLGGDELSDVNASISSFHMHSILMDCVVRVY